MTDHPWTVETTDSVTKITIPPETSMETTTAPSTSVSPSEIARSMYPIGKMQAQAMHRKTTGLTPSSYSPHICDFWSISGKTSGRPGFVILTRVCTSKEGFTGCNKELATDLLERDAALVMYRRIRESQV